MQFMLFIQFIQFMHFMLLKGVLPTHQPTHPTQFVHIPSGFGPQLAPQTVTHPHTNGPNCCITSTSSVTGTLRLSYWDKIRKGAFSRFRWIHLSNINPLTTLLETYFHCSNTFLNISFTRKITFYSKLLAT